jgi:hypothetical protein
MDQRYRYLHSKQGFTFALGGKPYVISSSHPLARDIRDAVMLGREPLMILELINQESSRMRRMVEGVIRGQKIVGNLTYDSGLILFNGQPLKNYAVERLVEMIESGHDASALARFVEKQQSNPNAGVIEHLYKFLQFGKIPLTEDGDFLAYKAVRSDYKDIHSGTLINTIGARPAMPREHVDPSREHTCSRGLHVCSYAYLPHFADAGGHVMICKVNPADVVAIPNDYNNTKMRVWTYEVVGEVTSYYTRGEDILATERLASEKWTVLYDEGDGAREVFDSFFTQDEAIAQANALKQENPEDAVWVEDTNNPEVLVYTA